MSSRCQHPVPLEELVDYYAGELDAPTAERIEEHYFACSSCAETLAWLGRLDDGVRALVRNRRLLVATTSGLVERVRAQGYELREYRADPGGTVLCTAGPSDDYLVTYYTGLGDAAAADLRGELTDLTTGETQPTFSVKGAPVDRARGELTVLVPGALNRGLGRTQLTFWVRVNAGTEAREIGPYHFHHTPWDELSEAERLER